ncbi:hypothetical protein GUITHDRAFT_79022, partial [Guillardia theta CCMP2712]
RFVCLSDTHSLHDTVQVPMGDVLIHAGDFTNVGLPSDVQKFNEFLGRLPHKHKIVIAGNHDISFDTASYPRFGHPKLYDSKEVHVDSWLVISMLTNATYVQDEEITVEGFRIWGSPWQPEFCDWGFNLPRGPALAAVWNKIPMGVDVVVTHGRLLLICNDIPESLRVFVVISKVRPAYHVFGHVHEGYGITEDGLGKHDDDVVERKFYEDDLSE